VCEPAPCGLVLVGPDASRSKTTASGRRTTRPRHALASGADSFFARQLAFAETQELLGEGGGQTGSLTGTFVNCLGSSVPAGLRHSADEQEPRATSDAVVERTVRERICIRNRLGDALDQKPGVSEGIDDRADWSVIEPHLELPAALPPGIGKQDRLEVRSGRGRDHHILRRAVRRDQEQAAGPKDASELTKRRPPNRQIVQDKRRGHHIE
jgi:hypothetical protein